MTGKKCKYIEHSHVKEDFLAIQEEIQNARFFFFFFPPILSTVEDTQRLLAVLHEEKYPSLSFYTSVSCLGLPFAESSQR